MKKITYIEALPSRLSAGEAAQLMGVSSTTVTKRREKGEITGYPWKGKHRTTWRYDRDEILRKRDQGPNP